MNNHQSKIIANGILRAVAILVAIGLFLFFLNQISSVIVYIVIAAVLSLIARPIILFLAKKLKIPNTLAVIFAMALMVLCIIGLIMMFIPLILKQGENLSLLNVDSLQNDLKHIFEEISVYFESKGINISDRLKNIDILSQFSSIPNVLNSVLGTIGSLGIGLFSVLFIAFFFMKDSQLLKNAILTVSPKKSERRLFVSIEKINNLLSRYFIGLLFQISILFILYTTVLLIFGIPNAIVISFLCALLNLVPYIGPLVGAIVMFILSMTGNIGQDFQTVMLPTTIYVMIGYLIAQLIDNFFSQPIIFSRTTKSHPLEIFLIIIICGLLFGITGMITAVPLYTALKVILKEFLADNKIVKSLTKNL